MITIQYLFKDQEVLETSNSLEKPPYGNIEEHNHDLEILEN